MAVLSILLLASVAVALLVRGMNLNMRRTHAEVVDAQLRLMLIAGEASARELALDSAVGRTQSLPLPAALASEGGTIELVAEGSGAVRIVARSMDRSMSQRVEFEKSGESWRIKSARIELIADGKLPG